MLINVKKTGNLNSSQDKRLMELQKLDELGPRDRMRYLQEKAPSIMKKMSLPIRKQADGSFEINWEQVLRNIDNADEPGKNENGNEAQSELLAQILEGIIARIEGIEARLELLEALEDEVAQEPGDETVRKSEGTGPSIALRRLELGGLVGELIDRKGRKWISSYIPSF